MPGRDSTPIRTAVVGTGRHARHHAERIALRGDCELVGVLPYLDRNESPSEPDRIAARSIDLVERSDVELVVVGTLAAGQAAIVRRALAAGKHVAVDRWLATSAGEAAELLEAARTAGRTLTTLHDRRSDGELRAARAVVSAGRIGPVESIHFTSWQPAMVGPPVERDDAPPWTPLLDLLAHLVDQSPERVAVETAESLPRTAAVRGATSTRWGVTVWLEGGLWARLERHAAAALSFESGWVLGGARGGYRRGRLFQRMDDGELYDVPFEPPPPDFASDLDALVAHLRMGKPPPATPGQMVAAAAMIDAANRSQESRRAVEVDVPAAPFANPNRERHA